MGRIYENAAFLGLKRRLPCQWEICYWRNPEGVETDFVIRKGVGIAEIFQVVYDLQDSKTKDRELRGLTACAKEAGLKNGLIVTRNTKGSETVGGVKVTFVPLREWLLKEPAAPGE